MAKTRLGDLLLSAGHVNEAALRAALKHHEGNRIRLGQSLVELGICEEEILSKALADQHGLDFVDLDRFPWQQDVVSRLPVQVMKRHYLFPMVVVNDEIFLATVCPPKKSALILATYETGLKARAVVATVSAISRAIREYEQKLAKPSEEISVEI